MRNNHNTHITETTLLLKIGLIVFLLLGLGLNSGLAQVLPPGVQETLKLSRAGIGDDVILSQIRNNQATYNLTADQIIFLKNEGVSQTVIKALMSGGSITVNSAPSVAVVQTTAPTPSPESSIVSSPSTVSLAGFQSQLSSSGSWVDVPGVGLCWQPTIALNDPDWRPYFDHGHWLYTDAGWSWQSDYTWGSIVFHYGRWHHFNSHWVWMPGYDWAPAWVCWREVDGYCGWAPLPPAAVYKVGVGLHFNGRLALDVDFGLGMDAYTFVGYDQFFALNYRPYLLPRERVSLVFAGSRILNGYRVEGGRFRVEGPGHDRVALQTHHEVRVEADAHAPRSSSRESGDARQHHGDGRDHAGW